MADSKNSDHVPQPEELKPQSEKADQPAASDAPKDSKVKPPKLHRRGSYRPSHKATFLALIVVIAILLINGGVIGFVLKRQSSIKQKVDTGAVTISQDALAKLGVNQTPVNDKGLELQVNPNAQFNGDVKIAGSATVAGQLTLNNKFNATAASFNSLQAGKTSLSELNVNGDGTLSNLNLRKDLTVEGASQLQGRVTIPQLLTVANVNVTANLSVGGTLSVRDFRAGSITSGSTLTIGGHVITGGSTPGVSRGSALGTYGRVGISGNDAAGTVSASAGVSGSSGEIACVSFARAYATTPHVVVTASAPLNIYISRNPGGFCVYAGSSVSPGGYFFDYIVEQ